MSLAVTLVPVTGFQQNCSVVWDDTTMSGVVVDPGGDVEVIQAAIAEAGITVERILITHAHLDHAGGASNLAEALNVPIDGPHEEDQFLVSSLHEQGERYSMAGCKPYTPSRWFAGGETVSVGSIEFEVIHTPGHTPGHVVFYSAAEKVAFVGDVLFKGSVGRSDFPRGNHATLMDSIKNKLLPLGDDITFVPGHGDTSTFGHEARTNPFLQDK